MHLDFALESTVSIRLIGGVRVHIHSVADGDDSNGGDGDGVVDGNYSPTSTYTTWLAISTRASNLPQTKSLILDNASTNSEFCISESSQWKTLVVSMHSSLMCSSAVWLSQADSQPDSQPNSQAGCEV